MTIVGILESLILGPLTILFECIYELANTVVRNPGLSIVALSLIMNILVLPLYKRADDMQEEARQTETKLQKGVAHIKKHFTSDERMMILQTYYSQNNYKPTYALKGSVSLLLQIPFFMAAYNFLSTLADLQGASLGPIANLGAPDGLLIIGRLSINLLPVLMTLVNVISSAIYLKGFPLKTKIQIYGMALFFLVFLYDSPAGLVFYWTLNNVFSLGKTIYYKCKIPKTVLCSVVSAVGLAIMAFGVFGSLEPAVIRVCVLALGLMCQCVWLVPLFSRLLKKLPKAKAVEPNQKIFVVGALFLSVLVGALIPSTYIAASPQEFVDVTYFYHPLWYVLNSTCLAIGTFMIWLRVFYWLAKPKVKVFFERAVWVASGVMVVNYLFFGKQLGVLSSTLSYEAGMLFSTVEKMLNVFVVLVVAGFCLLVVTKWRKVVTSILMIAIISLGIMSVRNVIITQQSISGISLEDTENMPRFEMSQDGQNVVVIMLDRAMGAYVPYILNEKPELREHFDGFTYYSNTVSFGDSTIFGVPPLMGGYEYTPVEMNKDDTRSLAEKHNEALKVMPVLFSQNGYEVTVCDPPYANYQWIPDLSIYDEYSGIDAYISQGQLNDLEHKQFLIDANYRNFFCFSLMKCMPLVVQPVLYHGGNYNISARVNKADYSNQVVTGFSTAKGTGNVFMSAFNVVNNLSNLTNVTEGTDNTFLFLQNEITHSPTLLQTPDYVPAEKVDNTQYDAEHTNRFVLENGQQLSFTEKVQMMYYHANVSAFLRIAEWLDYLRDNDVYDNTRIILVSDHGYSTSQIEELTIANSSYGTFEAQGCFPLLMVKDFDSKGFAVSDEFMTNADVPALAVGGLISNPTNPFTGKEINTDEKTAHDQFVIDSSSWQLSQNTGNTFAPGRWISVSDDIWDKDNWDFYNEEVVLKEHAFPE